MEEDKERKGYRRLVASPKPLKVLEADAIKLLSISEDPRMIIIAGGGGGIPVARSGRGLLGSRPWSIRTSWHHRWRHR